MMLFTDRDDPADWLRAGQALQRALLTAASLGVSTSFLTQPLELADLAFRDDPQYGRLRHPPGLAGHLGLSLHPRTVDASQRNSSSPVDRRGYVRRRLLGATPWLEVPQMVIRVGYPRDRAAKPDIRTPRREPDITDARSDPPVRVARAPRRRRAGPRPGGSPRARTGQAGTGGRLEAAWRPASLQLNTGSPGRAERARRRAAPARNGFRFPA